MKVVESLLIFIFLVFFGACLEEELSHGPESSTPSIRSFPNVDRALWIHFQDFEDEVMKRGFIVDLAGSNIVGTIEEIDEPNIAGSCSYGYRSNPKEVIIDKSFWDRASHHFREYIVFHELGHCFLLRDHFEACFKNNTYVSIMRSGNGHCRDNYTSQTRDYYIDELLEPTFSP